MSHDRGWRAACVVTIKSPKFHFDVREEARGVTAMVVGSGALLGRFHFTTEEGSQQNRRIEILLTPLPRLDAETESKK